MSREKNKQLLYKQNETSTTQFTKFFNTPARIATNFFTEVKGTVKSQCGHYYLTAPTKSMEEPSQQNKFPDGTQNGTTSHFQPINSKHNTKNVNQQIQPIKKSPYGTFGN